MIRDRHLARLLTILLSLVSVVALVLPAFAQERPALDDTATPTVAADEFDESFVPSWVLTLAPTEAWPGPSTESGSFGTIPVSTPLHVLLPQQGGRLYVRNTRTDGVAWVDAGAVAPIPDPTPEQIAAYLAPPPFEPWWGMIHTPTTAWSGPGEDATEMRRLRQWLYLRVVGPVENERVPVMDPRTEARMYVDLSALGPVGEPPDDYFAAPPPDTQEMSLPGRIVGDPFAYERPQRADHFSLGRLAHNQPVTVRGVVDQGEGGRWYRVGDLQYVQDSNVRLPRPPGRSFPGRWIDASLSEPVMVTAYDGDRPVYAALAVKGAQAFQTPTGVFRILRRVANETMDSATLGIPRNSPNGYYLQNVLYTQYFTGDGAALHYNYWRSSWGYAGSHGCLGMNLDDSRFFWDFAGVGTVVYIHN